MSYASEIQAAITEDGSRSAWNVAEWRAYFLSPVSDVPRKGRISCEYILRTFGAVRGAEILDAIEASNKHVFTLMHDGVDVTIPGVIAVLRSPLTPDERQQLRQQETAPRHVHLGLPEPRERAMKNALTEIANG